MFTLLYWIISVVSALITPVCIIFLFSIIAWAVHEWRKPDEVETDP